MGRYKLVQACACGAIRIAAGNIIATSQQEMLPGDVLWTATALPPGAIPVGQNPPTGTVITGVDSIQA